ncbi:prephenate dehydrogenase (NADP(+)) [Apophysomyces sp. BC1034]|nr:prephenate dehydrogenase (NADP(+)) [Apophysomyces sp. BC1015]KAG0171339.1 prephenate dehydrogenase (NADP(+)) [Apophysomyces sp. BC1021]KAG0184849.1 prephenate dehydrogenase (NADP(+)) [Apophysomyces sp. BC1034]
MAEKETTEIGIIGCGGMGKFYAQRLVEAGWKRVNVCDLPEKYDKLKEEFQHTGINVLPDGFHISRRCDWIMYAVEAEYVEAVVAKYGPATKIGAIVGGQTSVKQPEMAALQKYLPSDVHIVSCHSMHGPGVDPKGQPLVVIRQRATDEKYNLVLQILSCFESNLVHLSAEEHDRITADTQAVTHAAFLSMGSAWKANNQFPWLIPHFVGGIENVKVNVALRIYSNKWHVYAGLAIMNPIAKIQITQYARSVADLFKLMIQEKEDEFRARIKEAGEYVFGGLQKDHVPILLSDEILDEFSLSKMPKEHRAPNSHLSLLAMVDCWHTLRLNPYAHMVCQTPLFRVWMGITEYLFRSPTMLDDAIKAALYRKEIRPDDMEFVTCARGWAECVELGNMEAYQKRFTGTADFFRDRFSESTLVGNNMIAMIARNTQKS